MMDIQSFRRYAAIYGGDLSRWPAELLPAVSATLQHDPEMIAILDNELSFDAALEALPAIAPSSGLRARLLAIPQRGVERGMEIAGPWLHPRRLLPALALCSMLGLLIGVNDPIQDIINNQARSAWIFAPEQTVSLFE